MYSFTSRVRFSEVDESGRLSIPAIVDLLQDCTTFHSQSLGFGPAHARECGKTWMVSAWEIQIGARPPFGARISTSTWATGFRGVKASRNYTICPADDRDGSGESASPLVRAASEWFMFDARADRPIRPPEEEITPYRTDLDTDTPLDLPRVARRIPLEGDVADADPVTVTGAHLDTNHHVNNAQYVSMALGALDELRIPSAAADNVAEGEIVPFWLDVRYISAAKLGDVIHPRVYRTEDTVVVSLDAADGKPYAQVRLHG